MSMPKQIHAAAAAKQLNRTLFSETQFEGSVMVAAEDRLEVAVRGDWMGEKIETFSGFAVMWREAA
jgi:hypothetical protein